MRRSPRLAVTAAAIALGVVVWLAAVRSPEDRSGDAPIGASPVTGRPAPAGATKGVAARRTGATTGSAAGRTADDGNDGTPERAARDTPGTGQGRSAPGASDAAPRGRFARRARAILDRHLSSAGLDARVGEAEREALVDALVAVRASSRHAQRREGDEPAQAAARARLVVDTDRRFRDALGIGVARFLADAGPPNRVVDLAPATK